MSLSFANRKPLCEIVRVPERVESVYSLTQHVWAGKSDTERTKAKKENRVRLETLDEFLLDPVRAYLCRILEKVADKEGQGFWVQAEFGVGKSHLLAATAVLTIGGPDAWDRVRDRENAEKKAGPAARLDTLWRKKIEGRKIFPVVFSLEGCGGEQEKRLEDFILDEAQSVFWLREEKPLAVYPEEHLARLFLKEHEKSFRDELRKFLSDKRLMRGLPQYEYDELLKALKDAREQRDAGRVLMAFYRHKGLQPRVPTERGERLYRATQDIMEAGYDGIFIAIDEMSEYLRRSQFASDDEDCLLTLSSTLAKAHDLPVWTLVAAQSAHTNPKKIIGPDRLREELLEHKAERFRDIVVQRTRTIVDSAAVSVYFSGYKGLIPWVKETPKDEFEAAFPFPPDSIQIIRSISTKLTGTRSTISFLHRAIARAVEEGDSELVPLWRVFDDLMSYNETPSTSSSGAISIRSRFRGEVAALDAAQATLKHITDGQLAHPPNRTRAERILNTLFLYHLAGISGLTVGQVLDAVCDIKSTADELEAQLGHYETILEEMRSKLRSQISLREGRYEFVPKETGQYDDLLLQAADRLKGDPERLWQLVDRVMSSGQSEGASQFSEFVPQGDGQMIPFKVSWHGQERTGRVTAADLQRANARPPEIDTHGSEDDFLVMLGRRPMGEKAVEKFLKAGGGPADPRLCVWAPAEATPEEKSTLASVLAHLLVAEEQQDSAIEKEARREFRKVVDRAHTVLLSLFARGVARTSRTSLEVNLVGGIKGTIESMVQKAMDTCYRSRSIDFGLRKFDTQSAVKLLNGLVRRGETVSEGDQLWSAVENFAGPLGLVNSSHPRKLDPSASSFYQEIRHRIEERGGAGLEVKTVYNWFTGYDPSDGSESPGLTRRMVDIYLLCLAQQGHIRISDRKGGWIDRSSISGIEFKPEHLRGLNRVELPRSLPDWQVFSPYLETLTGRPEGDLGPKYDKAAADDALRDLWDRFWMRNHDVEKISGALAELFDALGLDRKKNPFDDLLIYWMQFSEEKRPEPFDGDETFHALRRGVICAAEVSEPGDLTSAHLTTFRENHRRLRELQESFEETGATLLRAVRMARAPLPDCPEMKEIRKAQSEVLKELNKVNDLIVNRDTVKTRLEPRLHRLEDAYIPTYLDELMRLDGLQNEMDEACARCEKSPELQALGEFSGILEAKRQIDEVKARCAAPCTALRRQPEDLDSARPEVKNNSAVKDVAGQPLTFARLADECEKRHDTIKTVSDAPQEALTAFARFLRSKPVVDRLVAQNTSSKAMKEVLEAQSDGELVEVLSTLHGKDLRDLAKLLAAVIGDKKPKCVKVADFTPRTEFVWEDKDIDSVVSEFRDYLKKSWEDGCYLKLEK